MTYRLVTIGPSHYCEKVRWALDRLQVPYVEDAHPPALHIPRAWWLGGGKTVPVLIAPDGQVYADSTFALEHLDALAAPEAKLYPAEHGAEVRALEERFDEVLGVHVRRLAYLHLLYAKDLLPVMTQRVGLCERVTFRATLPLLRRLMKRALKITPEAGARSRVRVLEVLDEVGALLADGRRFLVGERFSAADLSFAALLAPLTLPPEYGWPMPPLSAMPASFQEEVAPIVARPAGEFALRLYRDERRATPAPLLA